MSSLHFKLFQQSTSLKAWHSHIRGRELVNDSCKDGDVIVLATKDDLLHLYAWQVNQGWDMPSPSKVVNVIYQRLNMCALIMALCVFVTYEWYDIT